LRERLAWPCDPNGRADQRRLLTADRRAHFEAALRCTATSLAFRLLRARGSDRQSRRGEPGHDAWVVGDERFVGFEFESRSAEEYAKG
jgi:hypothetical protein